MTDTITLTGLVATEPKNIFTNEGLAITSFRLASTQRRFDRANQRWVDGDTNWYTITSFRQLAINVSTSIRKGERAIVTGRLRIKEWDNGEKQGTTIDIEADAIGHDLAWGSATFTRSISSSSASSSESSASESGEQPAGLARGQESESPTAQAEGLLASEKETEPVPF